MEKTTRLTTEEFIKEAKEIHGDKYDYSKVNYTYDNQKGWHLKDKKDNK